MAEKILFLAHADAISFDALGAAQALGGELVVGLVGSRVHADVIANCGASRFLAVEGDEFAQPRYSTDALAAETLCRASGATIVVASQTSRWARALAGVAQRLGGAIDTHVTAVLTGGVTRWYYRQRMEGVLSRAARPWFMLVENGAAPACTGGSGTVTVEYLKPDVPASLTRTSVIGMRAVAAEQQTIRPDAALLFVAGAGWTKKQKDGRAHSGDAARLITGFLDASQASLGSSKSLVDLSGEGQAVLPFLSHMNQVGQTGSTPRHPKGLATCCHGEEPHVVGWRFIKERRAINLDPNCGWARGKADVLYVADAFEVMSRVNELLVAQRS